MNANTVKYNPDRVIHIPVEAREREKPVRYATDKAVEKAHTRAIKKFANMFRKLAE